MTGFVDGIEDWQIKMGLATFARRHAANHPSAVCNGLFRMERAL
jgi:hypothetical protein